MAVTKDEMRANLSEAVKRAGLYEMADAFVFSMMEGLWADAADDEVTESNLRHAVYELVGKAYADPVVYPEGTPGKPGCQCVYGHRNDVAWHVLSCPWRRRVLADG